ncbi:hypothetical protein [Xanthobacter flavus]|uniref:hypothetical protein n=1 Tax=Xanthobacter flavus TaxID=281 RepID=UPI00372B9039
MAFDDYKSIHGRELGITRSSPVKLVLGGIVQPHSFSDAPMAPWYTVATAPSAAGAGAGALIFVNDGAAGSPILAFSDGANWKRSDTGAIIAAA